MASLGRTVFEYEGDVHVDLVALDVAVLDEDVHVLDPAPSMLRKVSFARFMPSWMACSKPSGWTELSSVTRATVIAMELPPF
jgi:hypothetical protein